MVSKGFTLLEVVLSLLLLSTLCLALLGQQGLSKQEVFRLGLMVKHSQLIEKNNELQSNKNKFNAYYDAFLIRFA